MSFIPTPINPTTDSVKPSPFIAFTQRVIPATFDQSLSYQEALYAILKYLNDMSETVNANADITDQQTAVIEQLTDYVNHYFDNLDVQEEINNKLDSMAESGQLQEIIISFLQSNSFLIYDTLAEVIADSTLNENAYIKTLGATTKGDAGVTDWQIKQSIPAGKIGVELNNGLYAVLESDVLYVAYLSLTNIDDLSDYNLTNIKEVVLDKNYPITAPLTLNDIVLNLNGYNIVMDGQNHNNIVCGNNVTVKNGEFTIDDLANLNANSGKCIVITGNNNIIDNIEFNGWISVYASTSINGLEIKNCLLNSYRQEIFLHTGSFSNINIHDNKQTREQNYTTPVQHHNIIQIINGIAWPYVANSLTHTIINSNYGNGIIVKNNKFKTINTRAVNIVNARDCEITYNECINPFGDKTGGSLPGYSDDVFVLDLCRYSTINNNTVENSGENGIDTLSCKYVTVFANKLTGIDSDGVDVNESDTVPEGAADSTVTNDDLVSEHITITGNEITTVKTGIRLGGRFISANGNTIASTSDPSQRVSFAFAAPAALKAIADLGTFNLEGNATDDGMNLGIPSTDAAQLMKNKNTRLYLDESSALVHEFSIDNSSLANNSDTKVYTWSHSSKFTKVKFYFKDTGRDAWFELPNSAYNNYGIQDYALPINLILFTTYKHFVNMTPNANTNDYRNLVSGTIRVKLM